MKLSLDMRNLHMPKCSFFPRFCPLVLEVGDQENMSNSMK